MPPSVFMGMIPVLESKHANGSLSVKLKKPIVSRQLSWIYFFVLTLATTRPLFTAIITPISGKIIFWL